MKRILVVGAGIGGLASAVRLQKAGYDVELLEKEPRVGGKMNQIGDKGFTFDVGPTIVMMPELYREVFEQCGRDPDDYIPMEKSRAVDGDKFLVGRTYAFVQRLVRTYGKLGGGKRAGCSRVLRVPG